MPLVLLPQVGLPLPHRTSQPSNQVPHVFVEPTTTYCPWREVSLQEAGLMGWAVGAPSWAERTGNYRHKCHLFQSHFPAT